MYNLDIFEKIRIFVSYDKYAQQMIDKNYTHFATPPSIRAETPAMAFVLQQIAEKIHIIKIHISLAFLSEGDTIQSTYFRWHTFLQQHFGDTLPALCLVHQAPCDNSFLSVEITEMTPDPFIQRIYGSIARSPYVLIEKEEYTELWSSGFYGLDFQTDIAANIAFEQLKSLLAINDFTFDHIVRQWNYIGNILEEKNVEGKFLQNYQVFNEVRNLYYNNNKQAPGYPAATGIGMSSAGIIIDIVAVKNSLRNIPIPSPIQKDAHGYEQEVLVGESLDSHPKKAPLFERARLLSDQKNTELYVSGTASIEGQKTMDAGNILKQTQNAIQYIADLCQTENIRQNFKDFEGKTAIYKRVRVYVKPLHYTLTLEQCISTKYQNASISIVEADICRDDLLVEIEADLNYLP